MPLRSRLHPLLVSLLLALVAAAAPARASVFYEYDVAARVSTAGLVSMEGQTSINEAGRVAFIGKSNAASGFESIYTADPGQSPVLISFNSSGRQFGPGLTINDLGQVLSRDSLSTVSLIRYWDSSTGGFTTLARSDQSAFLGLGFWPAGNDAMQHTWSAFDGGNELVLPGGGQVAVGSIFDTRPAMAETGAVIARVGPNGDTTDPIVLYNAAGAGTTVASAGGGWTEMGRSPGISSDGTVIVWAGNRGNGRGIFAASAASPGTVVRIAGENGNPPVVCPAGGCTTNPDLGYDAAGADLFLTFDDTQLDERVGVELQPLAGPGLQNGNSFVVVFLGTPNAASVDNPNIAGVQPLVFSAQPGMWSVRVDLETELAGANLSFDANGALPVAQVGDMIPTPGGAAQIDSLTLYDPIANVTLDTTGMARTVRRGDHQLVFQAGSAGDQIVVRAVSIDSDEDGLYDHWERAGGGIDVDQDGSADLVLNLLGASPTMRDLFLEVDWTRPRNDAVNPNYSMEPAEGALATLAARFAAAPMLANGIGAGVTLHVDAGNGNDTLGNPFSQNVPVAFRQGGDLVGQPGTPAAHLDIVHVGAPGSLAIPGAQVRSFESIKSTFFGTADKGAREFAFHYLVLADTYQAFSDADANGTLVGFEGPLNGATVIASSASTANTLSTTAINFGTGAAGVAGHGVLVTSGAGAGQLRRITANNASTLGVAPNWTVQPPPGSNFVIVTGSSGLAEAAFRPAPNNYGVPGNDYMMTLGIWGVNAKGWLATPFVQWRTMMHELGHNLGLRHCGTNPVAGACNTTPATYLSLMSYAHQVVMGTGVNSYSPQMPGVAMDPTFDDWFGLRPDFNQSAIHTGNTKLLGLGATAPSLPTDPAPTVEDYEQQNQAPLDLMPPSVSIDAPAANSALAIGADLTVDITATDNVGISALFASFDVDGDGSASQTGETLVPQSTGGNGFRVVFPGVSGSAGTRTVTVQATDAAGSSAVATLPVSVGQGGPIPGDLDGDSDVDDADLGLFNGAFGHSVGDAEYLVGADLDGDGTVTFVDYQLFVQAYNASASAGSSGGGVAKGSGSACGLLGIEILLPVLIGFALRRRSGSSR